MARTFNCGIGMVVIVDEARADTLCRTLMQYHELAVPIGRVVKREDSSVVIANIEDQWPS